MPETISPAQCRGARGMVGISQAQLAESARLSLSALRNFEAGRSVPIRRSCCDRPDATPSERAAAVSASFPLQRAPRRIRAGPILGTPQVRVASPERRRADYFFELTTCISVNSENPHLPFS